MYVYQCMIGGDISICNAIQQPMHIIPYHSPRDEWILLWYRTTTDNIQNSWKTMKKYDFILVLVDIRYMMYLEQWYHYSKISDCFSKLQNVRSQSSKRNVFVLSICVSNWISAKVLICPINFKILISDAYSKMQYRPGSSFYSNNVSFRLWLWVWLWEWLKLNRTVSWEAVSGRAPEGAGGAAAPVTWPRGARTSPLMLCADEHINLCTCVC